MANYISREDLINHLAICKKGTNIPNLAWATVTAIECYVRDMPAADVVEVVRCKDCKHSTLPSEVTQRYGKPGTLTCKNTHSPCNRRNVSENDFCSYGEMA